MKTSEKIRPAESRLPLPGLSSSARRRERKQEGVGPGPALYLSTGAPLSVLQGRRPCVSSPAKRTLSTGGSGRPGGLRPRLT